MSQLTPNIMPTEKKPAERVGDLARCRSRFYYLRISHTHEQWLEKCGKLFEMPEYKRLTRVHRAVLNHEIRQTSPNHAIDYSTGLHGWPNTATHFAYKIKRGWAVYRGDTFHDIYDGDGVKVEEKVDSSPIYKEIHKDSIIHGYTIWLNCPFDKKLNGKPY